MSSENPKRAIFEQFAAVARTLGSAPRLELLELLAQIDRSVEELAGLSGLTIANSSQHLQQLRRAGLVEARRDGKRVIYGLADRDIIALLGALRRITERNVGAVETVLKRYFRERDSLEAVSRKELIRRMRAGLVTVIDTRPAEEFAAGHLPGALNLPLRQLKRRLRQLPPEQEIVAYCRGAYCVLSYEAVAELRKRGFKAFRLEDGYPEWRAAGLPVERSATA
ncbi:MAG: metalloregulator ArsR/SmtB family transcription factor [Candidatus Binataceae bacterium]|nr:metalloregulator ArsR/SmtB family transcription factor [Candidatus Binataceae bacterium]